MISRGALKLPPHFRIACPSERSEPAARAAPRRPTR